METTNNNDKKPGFLLNFGRDHFDVMRDGRRVGRAYLECKKDLRVSLRVRVQLFATTRGGKINKYKVVDRHTIRLSMEALASLVRHYESLAGPIRTRGHKVEVHGETP